MSISLRRRREKGLLHFFIFLYIFPPPPPLPPGLLSNHTHKKISFALLSAFTSAAFTATGGREGHAADKARFFVFFFFLEAPRERTIVNYRRTRQQRRRRWQRASSDRRAGLTSFLGSSAGKMWEPLLQTHTLEGTHASLASHLRFL